MDEAYLYFCQYCNLFARSEFACPHCGEYKGLVKVSDPLEDVEY
jgi:predicted RNA-binding protein with PUA domain